MWFKLFNPVLINNNVSYCINTLSYKIAINTLCSVLSSRVNFQSNFSSIRLCSNIVESLSLPDSRLIKVAIIGVPNAGKSTIINQLVGQQIFSASSKVHTTRFKAKAVVNEAKTQIVFVDTPGLVGPAEAERHHLEPAFLADGASASRDADVVCVIHDASNKWTRNQLDDNVLHILNACKDKKSILVLNKVDLLKSKRKLLDLIKNLMCIEKESPNGWPHFEQTFMISALTGSGIPELKDYFVAASLPSPWLFENSQVTDQSREVIIEQSVRAALLDNLPEEVPYHIKPQIEHLHESRDGTITAVVLIGCTLKRISRMVLGARGWRIRMVAQRAEQQLQSAFNTTVVLKLVVTDLKQ